MSKPKPTKVDALAALTTGAFSCDFDAKNITYFEGQTPISEADIDAKYVSLISDWEAQEYARNRQAEYPSIAELTVALYDTDDKSAVEAKRAAVKLKYPKPE